MGIDTKIRKRAIDMAVAMGTERHLLWASEAARRNFDRYLVADKRASRWFWANLASLLVAGVSMQGHAAAGLVALIAVVWSRWKYVELQALARIYLVESFVHAHEMGVRAKKRWMLR